MEIFAPLHSFICGTTGTGKTSFFIKKFAESNMGGIFINYNGSPTPFIQSDQNDNITDLISAVESGEKIDYQPVAHKHRAKAEISYIIFRFMKAGFTDRKPFIFAIDECHILAGQGERNGYIEEIATGGRSKGFRGVFITQRPALVSKTLVTQSDTHFIFSLSDYEESYFRSKGIDFEKIKGMVKSGDPNKVSHKYIKWQNGIITGAFEEKL